MLDMDYEKLTNFKGDKIMDKLKYCDADKKNKILKMIDLL